MKTVPAMSKQTEQESRHEAAYSKKRKVAASSPTSSMPPLPNDIIRHLFTFLTIKDTLLCSMTCSSFRTVVSQRTPSQWLTCIFGEFGFHNLNNLSTILPSCDNIDSVLSGFSFTQWLKVFARGRAAHVVEAQLQREFEQELEKIADKYGFRQVCVLDIPLQGLEKDSDVLAMEKHHPNLLQCGMWQTESWTYMGQALQRIAARTLIPKLLQVLNSPLFPKHKNFKMFDLCIRGLFPPPNPSVRVSSSSCVRLHNARYTKGISTLEEFKTKWLVLNVKHCLLLNLFITQPLDHILADYNTPEFTRQLREDVDKMYFYERGRKPPRTVERQYLSDCRAIRDALGLADVCIDLNSNSAPDRLAEDVKKLREGKLQAEVANCAHPGVVAFCYAKDNNRYSRPLEYHPLDGVCACNGYSIHRSAFPTNNQLRANCASDRIGDCEQIALFCRAVNALENVVNAMYHPVSISYRGTGAHVMESYRGSGVVRYSRTDYARFLICMLIGRLKGLVPANLSEYLVEHVVVRCATTDWPALELEEGNSGVKDGELMVAAGLC